MHIEGKRFFRVSDRIGAYLWTGIVVLLFSIIGIYLSHVLAQRDLFSQTSFVAEEVQQRSESMNEQIQSVIHDLEAAKDPNPCSAANIDLMKRAAIASSYLQLVGYVRDNRLICSSYGVPGEDIDLGPVGFVTSANFAVRTQTKVLPDTARAYIASTQVSSGFTAFVLPNLPQDVAKTDLALSLGLYGTTSGVPIFHRGEVQSDWLRTDLKPGEIRHFISGSSVVALFRSTRYQITSYCAVPIARLYAAWRDYALMIVPLAVLLGFCLAQLVILIQRRNLGLRYQLREAIKSSSQLYMLYQPIVELNSGRWVGAESLVRWRQPGGQVVTPDVFIPIVELSGLMAKLTSKVVELVMQDVTQCLARYPDFHININFAASDLESPSSLDQLRRQLHSSGIDEGRVTVEVTEGALLKIESARRNIKFMRDYGLRVAIDDFGTGYCGLSYLVSLDLDFLKIDKSFVDTIGTDSAARSVIPHIIQMAKTLGLEIVAEGVERDEQADYLRQQGVKYVQGWLYAKPMPIAELVKKLARNHTDADARAPTAEASASY